MAGTVKDMSLIKQVLQHKQLGESNPETQRHETQRQIPVSLSDFRPPTSPSQSSSFLYHSR